MLELSGVCVSYGRVPALVGVDLQVGAGEVVALVGANGAGKTTLLRAVSGLLRPGSGTMKMAGRSLLGLSPAQVLGVGIAHVPQGRRVFGRLSVRENLAVGAHRAERAAAAVALARVHELFPVLSDRADQPAGTLSGGEQQQLAFGRALMASPRVLLLDEPTTGLAPPLADRVLAAARQVARDGGAVLLVDLAEPALRTADRGVVLETGQVVLTGPAADLLADDRVRVAHLGG